MSIPEDDDLNRYIGMEAETAVAEAERAGWPMRRVLTPTSMMTIDYREDRLNLYTEADSKIVIKASVG